jgi:hypothetical protein
MFRKVADDCRLRCNLVDTNRFSEELTASIIPTLMMEAVSSSAIFISVAVRILNLTII